MGDMCKWLYRTGHKAMKMLPYYPKSNEAADRMIASVKVGLKAYSLSKSFVNAYLSCKLLT